MGFLDRYTEETILARKILVRGILVVILLLLLYGIFKKVPAGHVGVLYDNLKGGVQLKEFHNGKEGWGAKIPLTQTVYFVPTTIQTDRIDARETFRDKNDYFFSAVITVRYQLDKEQVAELIQTQGNDFTSIINSGVKEQGNILFSEQNQQNISKNISYYTDRLKLKLQDRINEDAIGDLKPGYIRIVSLDIEGIYFHPEIEQRLADTEKRKNILEQTTADNEISKINQEKTLSEAKTEKERAGIESQKNSDLKKVEIDMQMYAIQKEAETKADAIRKLSDAYRNVPPSYMVAKAYESIKESDKIIIGLETLNDPTKVQVISTILKPIDMSQIVSVSKADPTSQEEVVIQNG